MKRLLYLITLIVFFGAVSCGKDETPSAYVPVAPNYSDEAMWINAMNDKGEGVDVFYVVSTWEFDWQTESGIISHYADVFNEDHREDMATEIHKIAAYMADGNNFYSPYYRHITLDTWATLDEDIIDERFHNVAFIDVQNAFDYFIEHFNNGRPFILAGFSQGGKAVVELIKVMPEHLRERMVAAYVLGYKVTPNDVEQAPWLIAAKGATDTGVVICYNSVSDVKYIKPIISAPCVMCINPVNWRTDATPATLRDSITVTLSPEHNVLVVDGYDGSHLPNILDIINVGDYHSIEPWEYSEYLHANIKQRIKAYQASIHSSTTRAL